jgi:hypothetical protein
LYICYVDEAGCLGTLPDSNSSIQPIFVICGVIIEHTKLSDLTHDFINLKRRFYPNIFSRLQYLDCIKQEIKGADIRSSLKGNQSQKKFALSFTYEILSILERYNIAIIGRVWIKPIALPFNGRSIYTSSVQKLAIYFQSFLVDRNNHGIVVADSRDPAGNANVSHSIFTQKYKPGRDPFDRILEMPLYGHSDNHAMIQLADLLVSAIIFPISTRVFCSGYVINTTHHHEEFLSIRSRFGARLENLQYRFIDPSTGRNSGGIIVSDPLGHQNGSKLFRP